MTATNHELPHQPTGNSGTPKPQPFPPSRPPLPPPHRGRPLLIDCVALLQLLVELAPGRIFQDQVHTALVVEVVVQAQDIGMPGGKMGRRVRLLSEAQLVMFLQGTGHTRHQKQVATQLAGLSG